MAEETDDRATDEELVAGTEATEDAESVEEETPRRRRRGHDVDKGLQRTQQRVRALEDQIGDVNSKIDQLLERGTPAQQEKASQVRDQLDSMEQVDGKSLRAALDEMKSDLAREVTEAVRPATEQTQAEQYWRQWEKQHPDVANQRDEMLEEAREFVEDRYGGSLDKETQRAMVQATFDRVVKERETRAQAKRRQSTKSDGSETKKTRPKGARSGKGRSEGAAQPATDIGPLWVPPDDGG